MVEHQVNMIMSIVDGQWVLSLDKREALAQFQQKHLHVVNQLILQILLLIAFPFFYAKEFQRIGALHNILRCLYLLPFMCQRQNALFILANSQTHKESTLFMKMQFIYSPPF